MSWPFHLNEDGSLTTYNPLWPLERRQAAQALSDAEEKQNVTTKPAPLTKGRPFPTPEEKAAWVKQHEAEKAAQKAADALKPPFVPPAERRTATAAPEPRKRSLDEILSGRQPELSPLDRILSGMKPTPAGKDATPDAELTAAQRAAWDALDALMDAGVTGDSLTNAVTAFAASLEGGV